LIFRENHENQHHNKAVSDPGSNILKRNCFLYKDARVHYVVLKQQPHHTPTQQQHQPPQPHPTKNRDKTTKTSTTNKDGHV
ncbi:hypothetical protein, partial [Arthrobacter sp. E3]|uniref:hypothetical protein n=1 Tax=Arthrobacter sp. E3 TaxID=517402 RepID=UPI001A950B54